ncbi:MAG: hypothetical protein AB7V77_01950 [Candidatus Woesearchaeota archaeon]
MKVVHNHICSLCGKNKTCFVFGDFNSVFSSCRDCFEILEQEISFTDEIKDICSLCDQYKCVKKIEFADSMFFSDFKICNSCNNHLKKLVETSDENEIE